MQPAEGWVPKTLHATLLKTLGDDGKKGGCDPLGAKACVSASSVQLLVVDHGSTSNLMSRVAALQTVVEPRRHFPKASQDASRRILDHRRFRSPSRCVSSSERAVFLGSCQLPNGSAERRWHDPFGRLRRVPLHALGVGHDLCDQGGRRRQHQRRAQSPAHRSTPGTSRA